MKVVLDTNLIVVGLRSHHGASYQLLEEIPKSRLSFILSVTLFLEYESVLKREVFLKDSGLRIKDVNAVLDMLALRCYRTKVYYLWRPQLKDPNDDMVLETAISGSADAIVTFNRKDFIGAADKFNIKVMLPNEYLTTLRRLT